MPTRTARTAWDGGLMDGSGQVELSSSGAGTYEVSFPRRTADDAQGVTSPEELIAAAHSACYAMQLSGVIAAGRRHAALARREGGRHPRPGHGRASRSPASCITVRGEVEGLDADGFAKAAQDAKDTCPVSKALTGTTITLDAALVS